MEKNPIKDSLRNAYELMLPHSDKYRVDFDRYLCSLSILKEIPDFRDKSVLDIGTGIGLIPLALNLSGIRADGLDYYIFPESENEMFGLTDIDKIKSIWSQNSIDIFNANIFDESIKTDSKKYDVVISEATIEHLKDPKKFLEVCKNYLKPNGYILISTPNLTTLSKRIGFLFGKSPYWPIGGFFRDGEKFTGHWREYTLKEVCSMLDMSGFEIVKAINRNMLAKFKRPSNIRKNITALIVFISNLIPGSKEMNFVLARKR